MATSVRSAVDVAQDIVRPYEDVKVAIDAKSAPRDDVESETWSGADHDPPILRRKVLAVFTHVHPSGLHEQGCVFVLTQKPSRMQATPDEYAVEHAYPIISGFAISMSQPRQSVINLSTQPPGSGFAFNQPKKEITVTINPGEDTPFPSITLQTDDTQGLRRLLDECKRLKEASAAQMGDEFDFEPFAWVTPYIANHVIPPLLSSIPADLRKLQKPVHDRLPPASAGQPGNDITDIEVIREDWMRRKVQDEVLSPCEKASLKIRIGTFNVNGNLPSQDLSAWVRGHIAMSASKSLAPLKEVPPLSADEIVRSPLDMPPPVADERGKDSDAASADTQSLSSPLERMTFHNISLDGDTDETAVVDIPGPDVPEDPEDPDMLVLGFQELDLSTGALLYSSETTREDAWCTAVFAGLGEKAVLYEKLASKQLVGMLLVVVIKKRLRACFGDVRVASVGAGIMGIMGNKGATGARMLFTPFPPWPAAATAADRKPVALTFVNAHLAAFDEMFDKRNADFHDLSRRLFFDSAVIAVEDGPPSGSWYTPAPVPLELFETDALFWLVNLNYRVNLPDADVRGLLADEELREENVKVLRRFDQLTLAMNDKKAFEDFNERPIVHLPSYRFSAGVTSDALGYDIKRKPAWTDRVLYMASGAVTVKQTSYESHPTITMSDHRPVSAEFVLEVPVVGVADYESYVQRLWRDVSGVEYAEDRPRIQVAPTNIDFSTLAYKSDVMRTLEVQNVGKIACSFRFVAQSPTAAACPSWLRIDTMTGLILPGETVQIGLTAHVDEALASQLNLGQTRLEDTLVLHTAHGRDHFVAISGEYERTCFATSIAWLVRLPGSVRALASPSDLLSEERSVNAPREIMRLVNWLMSNATETDGLFTTRGDAELMRRIRECLDTGEEFSVSGAEDDPEVARAFADTLLQLLASLTEPVIPVSLHAKCAQAANRDEAFELLDQLPVVNVNVWISLTAFLHFIGQQEAAKGRVGHLVAIFTPVLFRDDLASPMLVSVIGKRNFLRYFIG